METDKDSFGLQGLTTKQLEELWDQADDMPGGEIGGWTEGEISKELARRRSLVQVDVHPRPAATIAKSRQPRRTPRSPIDGSMAMRALNRRAYWGRK